MEISTQNFYMTIEEPMDLIRLMLDERVLVKCKEGRHIYGTLHAYDPHLNMVIGDAEESTETVTDEVSNIFFHGHLFRAN